MNVIKQQKPIEEENEMHATQKRWFARSIVSVVLLSWAAAAAAHEQHGGYSPAVIEVKRGEQIRFVLRNVGTEAHEFLLATTAENLKHGEAMRKNPDMEHDEPNGLRLGAKKSG